ncbi:hypothetical protein CPT_Stills3 [Bacillus phage Stills]|uniref:Uncharacterized protein n=1 Tax=Bacillus phage Stills TaxID=1610833 RepID=A0A0E3T5I2_9CAUD|nr:hypothetical protein CPT_Stills3 [Bacillus phage Stills]AKC02631.1 hypothetical protein CPT_Stills3 [Bacillus phage Stills]
MEEITCPHCSHGYHEWWELLDFEKDDQQFNMPCDECGKEFGVKVEVVRTFHTSKDLLEDE